MSLDAVLNKGVLEQRIHMLKGSRASQESNLESSDP